MMRKPVEILVFTLFLLLQGCGEENVCVIGIGDCSESFGELTFTSADSVATGSTTTFTVSGGTPGYSFSVISGTGSVSPTSTDSALETTFTPGTAGTACVRVTDTAQKTVDRCITVSDGS